MASLSTRHTITYTLELSAAEKEALESLLRGLYSADVRGALARIYQIIDTHPLEQTLENLSALLTKGVPE